MNRRILALLALLLPGFARGEYLRNARGGFVPYAGKFNRAKIRLDTVPPRRNEFRGVWIATVGNIDFARSRGAAEFQARYRKRMKQLADAGFTAVIFQVRANCDAFYPSRLAPWSRWMAGKEGAGFPNFDPLRFMADEAHRHGLEFHAWFNPYRVTESTGGLSKNAYLATLHPDNFARRNPRWVIAQRYGKKTRLFLDPGIPQVARHLAEVVREVATRYPVDAIHFDDYFYPYDPLGDEDARTFAAFNSGRLSLADWRRHNTYTLILAVRRTIDQVNRATGRRVRFGVSPFGIWANIRTTSAGSLTAGKECYSGLYADTRRWVRERLVDYIAPQIYWSFGYEKAAYAALTDWWCATVRGTGVRLYIGMGVYRAAEWAPRELVDQMRWNRTRPEVDGAAFFSCRSLFDRPAPGAVNLLNYLRAR